MHIIQQQQLLCRVHFPRGPLNRYTPRVYSILYIIVIIIIPRITPFRAVRRWVIIVSWGRGRPYYIYYIIFFFTFWNALRRCRVKLKDSCKTDKKKKNRRDVEKLPRSRRGVSEFIRSPNRFRRRRQTLLERRRPARARRRGVVPIGSMYNDSGSGVVVAVIVVVVDIVIVVIRLLLPAFVCNGRGRRRRFLYNIKHSRIIIIILNISTISSRFAPPQ